MPGRARHVLFAVLLLVVGVASAQDIEPRQYANAPIGFNFLAAGPVATNVGFPLDPAIPVTDAKIYTYGGVLAYVKVIRLGGQSAKLSMVAPYIWLDGSALYEGVPVSRQVNGLTDMKIRLAANILGAPAMDLKEFRNYKQDLVVGTSLTVTCPTGQYDPERLVNIGANRWAFKAELGASQVVGKWILELSATAEVFTDNPDFFIGRTREQDPVFAGKGHAIRNFGKGRWASVDLTYYTGGSTTIDGVFRNDLQQNWRTGATLSSPVALRHSLRLNVSGGVYARTGNNYNQVALTWQYQWGPGLARKRPPPPAQP